VHPAACGAAPEPVAGVGSEGVGVHAVAGGAVPGAVVVVVASVAVEVGLSGGAGAGTSVPGSVAVVSVPSVTAGSVSAAPVAAGEVSASGAVAELLGVPEGSGGARSSARAVLTQIDAQANATSSAAVPPRTRSHRWSASKATRFGTKSAPLAMATVRTSSPGLSAVDTSRARGHEVVKLPKRSNLGYSQPQVELYSVSAGDLSKKPQHARRMHGPLAKRSRPLRPLMTVLGSCRWVTSPGRGSVDREATRRGGALLANAGHIRPAA
jgi:hypothetical protein